MIYLIAGASHTGKTWLAQRLLETLHIPYLSLDHLKMGLIRSEQTSLTVYDDKKLTEYLWPIVKEMIKTAIENHQHLIIEGCYIPFDYKQDFTDMYLRSIKEICLVFSAEYIQENIKSIQSYSSVIEQRLDESYVNIDWLMDVNLKNLTLCREYQWCYYVVEKTYDTNKMVQFMIDHDFFTEVLR